MSKTTALQGLEDTLARAETRQRQREGFRDFLTFARAYKDNMHGSSSGTWPHGPENYDAGRISFVEDGERKYARVSWMQASQLAEKKRTGEITDIRVEPADKGKIAGSIVAALNLYSGKKQSIGSDTGEAMVKEAIAAMYLLDLTNSRPLLRMIESGLKDGRPPGTIAAIGSAFQKYGMIDEYHSDLPCGRADVLLSVLEAKLRPEGPMTEEEAFEKGYRQAYEGRRSGGVWGDVLDAAKITFVAGEKRQSERVTFPTVMPLADRVLRGEIEDVQLPPEEKGKLYASIMKSRDFIMSDGPYSGGDITGYLAERMVAWLYLLGRLDAPESVELLSDVLEKRSNLVQPIRQALSRYGANQ